MFIFVKILTSLKEALFNGVIIQRRTRIWCDWPNCAHLGKITELKKKIYSQLQRLASFADVAENNIVSRTDPCIQSVSDSIVNHPDRQPFFHRIKSFLVK